MMVAWCGETAAGTVTDAGDGAETIAIGMTGALTATTTREDQTRAGIMAGTRAITGAALSSGFEAARVVWAWDAPRTSRCAPAWMRPRPCWTKPAPCRLQEQT